MRIASLFFLLCIFLTACVGKDGPGSETIFGREKLSSQIILLDNSRDTVITTKYGARLNIPKNSFSQPGIKLEIKEAYSIDRIVTAGLITRSGSDLLSSDGMIYINAMDGATMRGEITVSIPTEKVDPDMKLYEGREKDGKIDWINPSKLQTDTLNPYFAAGRSLFQRNCASCHGLDKVLSGPALSGVEGRGPWNNRERLFSFTRNPAAFIPRTCYTKNLQAQFGSLMPGFDLSDDDLTTLYDYIRNEDMQKGKMYSTNYSPKCDDSCYVYDSLLRVQAGLQDERDKALSETEDRVEYIAISPRRGDTVGIIPKVAPPVYRAEYYSFKITSMGWYNIDKLLDAPPTELKVRIEGEHRDSFSVFFIAPEEKIYDQGGLLGSERNVFGFYTHDGKLPIPAGTNAIVFAVGESGGDIFFKAEKFTIQPVQEITLTPIKVSREELQKTISDFRLEDFQVEVADSKNAAVIRAVDAKQRQIEALLERSKPKNCDCSCAARDSSSEAPDVPPTSTSL